jgi:hypothetical protein
MEAKPFDTNMQPELLAQPLDYICVDPEIGELVFDYFNDLLTGDQKQAFEEHLSICLDCEEMLGKMAFLERLKPSV